MTTITRDSLLTLEAYAKIRPEFRSQVMAHKKNRRISLGNHITLIFEDELTVRYQVQEMLRIEKVFEAGGIHEELEAYNPLIPDGHNWKATFMIEYDDPDERAQQLSRMIGIEDKVWLQVESCERVYPIADEDLERDNDHKTSSVHFLRFELDPSMIAAVQHGATISAGVDHPAYSVHTGPLPTAVRDCLAGDLQATSIN